MSQLWPAISVMTVSRIMFGDSEVVNPFITQVRFENTGKQVIEATDFLEAIEICRGEAQIIDWSVVAESETTPC